MVVCIAAILASQNQAVSVLVGGTALVALLWNDQHLRLKVVEFVQLETFVPLEVFIQYPAQEVCTATRQV